MVEIKDKKFVEKIEKQPITPTPFDNALKKIAGKITKPLPSAKQTKTEVLDLSCSCT